MTTFVIPDFFSRVKSLGVQAHFPALRKILSKATVSPAQYADRYALINSLLCGNNRNAQGVGASMQLAESGKPIDSWVCCASPAIVMPNRDHLDLVQASDFDLSKAEATHFCNELNDFFQADGLRFVFYRPDQWYCYAESGFSVSPVAPSLIQGQDIAAHIPLAHTGHAWRKIFNDIQLLLHHSVTNQKRTLGKKPEINSLWLWGGGELKPGVARQSSFSLMSNDLYSRGLALSVGMEASGLSNKDLTASHIVIADAQSDDWLDWDARFFLPALQNLKRGDIKSMTFHLDLTQTFTLEKHELMRFWRKEKPVMGFAGKPENAF